MWYVAVLLSLMGGSAQGLKPCTWYLVELASLMLVFLGVSLAFRGQRPSFGGPASLIPVLLESGSPA